MNMRNLAAILVAITVLTCGCMGGDAPDRSGKTIEDITMLDWALWIASIVTWDDIKEFAKWAVTEGSDEIWDIVEWFIKMLIMADAHNGGNT